MIKLILKSTLNAFGYELRRRTKPPPQIKLNIFDLCARDLMNRIANPFLVQIGANDGLRVDPVRLFITRYGWPALLIEPHPVVFEQLQRNYAGFPQVRARNIAISDCDGTLSLYVPDQDIVAQNARLLGLCSLDRDHLVRELKREGFSGPESKIGEVVVCSKTVPSLLQDEGISRIDVLQLDTEGYDWRILSQFNLDALGVKLIQLEFFHLTPSELNICLERLTQLGFATAFSLGDLIAYRNANSVRG